MKLKRLLGIFLALSLALSLPLTLTGCQKEEDDTESNLSIRQNIVLNMYILTDKETNPELAEDVELALNEILLPEYRTVLKLNYIVSDGGEETEYWKAIDEAEAEAIAYQEQLAAEAEAARQAAKEAAKNKSSGAAAPAKKEEEEIDEEELEELNESEYDRLSNMVFGKAAIPGKSEAIEPGIKLDNPQLDIFVVNDPKKYIELINDERLAPLDSYFSSEARLLTSYVYPTFLTGAKLSGNVTYGIPVNKPIGEYEYLVFNKDLLTKYGYSSEDMKTIDALAGYLALIQANEPGVVPLALSEGVDPQFFEYYDEPGNAIGMPSNQMFRSAFGSAADATVKAHFTTLRNYRVAGYIPDVYTPGTPFAVDIRKGSAASPAEWAEADGTEYEYQVYKRPLATNNNTLDSIFVVSAASRNPQRAAEIITLFNTVPELANMLQYGIDGVNYYSVTDPVDGKVHAKLPESNAGAGYYMDFDLTGNHYIKYNLEGVADHMEADQKQNADSIVSLYYGFEPDLDVADRLLLEKANDVTTAYYPGLCRGDYDVETVYNEVNARLASLRVTDADINAWIAENPELHQAIYDREIEEKEAAAQAEKEKESKKDEEADENDAEDAEGAEGSEGADADADDSENNEEETASGNTPPQREIEDDVPSGTGSSPFDELVAKINSQFDTYYERASNNHHALWSVSSSHFNRNNKNDVKEEKVVNDLKMLKETEE